MRRLSFLGGAIALFGFAAYQAALPAPLAHDYERLAAAPSVTVDLTIRVIGQAPTAYHLTLAKPNLFKIAGDDGFVLSNGTTIYTYTKSNNSYFEALASDTELSKILKRPELFGWAPFFPKNAEADVAVARLGGSRTIAGNPATEVEVTMKQLGVHGTLFVDQKQGVAVGYDLVSSAKEYLAIASQVTLGTDAVPAEQYAFAAPAGAKKTEAPKPDDATFANVAAIMTASCMPCHSAQQRSGGVDLTTYAAVSRSVTPGNGASSRLVTVLRTPGPGRMPQGRAALPDAKINQIQKWIDNGAKNN